ncbi:MAG: class I SAM-dependent methyltransferase [Planctomycetes bacterium]|nr:class I SAM-dependent methyltransferase [Planctomycetota bacterium]
MPTTANPLWNPWCSDARTLELYRKRCRREADEMTCAAQAAGIFGKLCKPGETLLDAGCGGGYYWWSLANRGVKVEYSGLDYTPEMIELARAEMCQRAHLPAERFILDAIENLDRPFDNILCFNVLTNNPHYALPLERLLACAKKRILIRESMGDELIVRYTPDPYLDEDKRHIRVYHNQYPLAEVKAFMEENGFAVTSIVDERSKDGVEMVVDIPHRWRILLGERKNTKGGR